MNNLDSTMTRGTKVRRVDDFQPLRLSNRDLLVGLIALNKPTSTTGEMNSSGGRSTGPLAVFAAVTLSTGDKDDSTSNGCSCKEESGPCKDKVAGGGNTCDQSSSDKDVQRDTEERGQLCRTI